ncbi:hypothetical protein CIB48_g2871 [Xylaria polymorpha]|nr:hypothetical protein CIB48_g2871 [Xylaria polymorpha]
MYGHKGGMQRAILCSYDWRNGTFVREAVIRFKTLVLDRMFRVYRFRFALSPRTDDPGRHAVPLTTAETWERGSIASGSSDEAVAVSIV